MRFLVLWHSRTSLILVVRNGTHVATNALALLDSLEMEGSLAKTTFDSLLEKQTAERTPDPEPEFAGALWLHTDMGPSFYLTREGAVLLTDDFDNLPPRQATPDERGAGLVLGARNLKCDALLNLLPPMPNNAVRCLRCQGKHWARLHLDLDMLVMCVDCSGRGWNLEPNACD